MDVNLDAQLWHISATRYKDIRQRGPPSVADLGVEGRATELCRKGCWSKKISGSSFVAKKVVQIVLFPLK